MPCFSIRNTRTGRIRTRVIRTRSPNHQKTPPPTVFDQRRLSKRAPVSFGRKPRAAPSTKSASSRFQRNFVSGTTGSRRAIYPVDRPYRSIHGHPRRRAISAVCEFRPPRWTVKSSAHRRHTAPIPFVKLGCLGSLVLLHLESLNHPPTTTTPRPQARDLLSLPALTSRAHRRPKCPQLCTRLSSSSAFA